MALPIHPVALPRPLRLPAFADPTLGDRVRAYADFGTMLVVDVDGRMVTAARRTEDGVRELTAPRAWLRKVG